MRMLLTYLDESYTKKRYLIAALLVPETEARSLTIALDKVVADAAWEYPVSVEAELHAHDIVAGKREWEKLAPMMRARIGVYNKAFRPGTPIATASRKVGLELLKLRPRAKQLQANALAWSNTLAQVGHL